MAPSPNFSWSLSTAEKTATFSETKAAVNGRATQRAVLRMRPEKSKLRNGACLHCRTVAVLCVVPADLQTVGSPNETTAVAFFVVVYVENMMELVLVFLRRSAASTAA